MVRPLLANYGHIFGKWLKMSPLPYHWSMSHTPITPQQSIPKKGYPTMAQMLTVRCRDPQNLALKIS